MSKPASAIPASAATPRRRFPLERRPLFTALFAGNSVAELVRSARAAHWQGADAVCAELACLPREERTAEALRPFMTATPLPTMCCLYRNDRLGQDDDARQKDLLAALEAGAACIDVMGDLYDPSPREWTRKPSAIAKQKRLIAPSLGLALTFAKLDPRDAHPMPPLANLKGVFENLRFQLP